MAEHEDTEQTQQQAEEKDAFRWGSKEAVILGVKLLDSTGQEKTYLKPVSK